MKFIFVFLFCLQAFAEPDLKWCEVYDKKTKAFLNSYRGVVCDHKRFGGPWGDKDLTYHKENPAKLKELEKQQVEWAAREKLKTDRNARIKSGCVGQTGLMKDLCDEMAEK